MFSPRLFSFPRSLVVASVAVTILALVGCQSSPPASDAAKVAVARATSDNALFENVAPSAGLKFVHIAGQEGRVYFVEVTAPGCAFLDYDGDGDQDIFVVQSGSSAPAQTVKNRPLCALYRNNGDGTFADVTAGSGLDVDMGYGQGVAVADYDNDGYDDIFVTAYGGNHLFHNEGGKGQWKEVTQQMGLGKVHDLGYATSAAWGDYDGDGRLDLYVCHYALWSQSLDKSCPIGDTGKSDYCPPLNYDAVSDRLYRNTGARFVDVSEKSGIASKKGRGLAVAWTDYDGDGKPDIYVANDQSAQMLWHNNGDGTFGDVAPKFGGAYDGHGQMIAGMGIAIADYDHAGAPSIYVSNFAGLSNILFKNENGSFRDITRQSGMGFLHLKFLTFGCEFLDYDADSWPDIINNNGHVQVQPERREPGVKLEMRKQLLRNTGAGKFAEISDAGLLGDLSQPLIGRGLAVGDYDNDGRIDILAVGQNAPVQLLRNLDANGNHWVSFDTIGTKSNRDGIGARVEIRAGGVRQTAEVRAGSSYLSTSDKRVYFGLGKADKIESVLIKWPSGQSEKLSDLSADMFYTVTEGRGITKQSGPTISSDKLKSAAR